MRFAGKFVVLLWLVLACFSLGQSAAGAAEEMTAAELLQSCDDGDSGACDELGLRLHNGTGVRKDDKAAAAMHQRACDGGDAIGCNNLGWHYDVGSGVPKNKPRAASLYGRSCDGGFAKGCANLAGMKDAGDGIAVDKLRAAELYARACDAEDARGCSQLAYMNYTGDGIAADPAKAEALYAKACAGGRQSACPLSSPVVATAPAPQCRTVKGTSDVGAVERTLCMENDGQWRQRGQVRVVEAPVPRQHLWPRFEVVI